MNIVSTPKFNMSYLKPKYWPVWIGFGLLALIVNLLPFSLLRSIGFTIGDLARKVLKSREKVARTNLQLCFPNSLSEEIDALVKMNFKNAGMAIIETGMAWFWPDCRVKRHSAIKNSDYLLNEERNNRGVIVVCAHFFHLEMTARIFSTFAPGYGVYRPHSNPAYEFIQHWGRTRKGHQMVDRKDMKSMIRVLKAGNRLWYLPDHDYGNNGSVFAPFFGVEANTVAGTAALAKMSKCAVISATSIRTDNTYNLVVEPDFSKEIPRDPVDAATVVNRHIERMIMKGVAQWMWLHKRFKTTPDGKTARYI
ncbi:LpxL/LpxP family Kdo(2)-lipid IV(A) lauroyl/palmitoleoyl acyltransferase [Vibrio rotiferianus]|uniref:LpxL/LpxP family Kdo(2)-lipid IV(A) lauroyl/palmitoleoyl acyltransferase n=1 Tax=Vibrio rotiferianus TaxID=190895 RepID=UPI00406AAECD